MSSTSGGGGSMEPSMRRGQQQRDEPGNQRYSNLIYDSEVFLTKLREFKPQSLGCLEARRKSSSTLIFPNPRQACMGPPKCPRYPHEVKPTPGYWIECHGPGVASTKSSQGHQAEPPGSSLRSSTDDAVMGAAASGLEAIMGRGSPSRPSDELKLVVDCPSRSSGLSSSSRHLPTASSTDQPLMDKDSISNLDDLSEGRKQFSRQESNTPTTARSSAIPLKQRLAGEDTFKKQDSIGSLGRTHGGASSSPDMSNIQMSNQQFSGEKGAKVGAQSTQKSANELRKRLNKRTMTRDDIDLHKPRRGTPNITITEPSFNQSTTTYHSQQQQRTFQKTPTRQGSQPGNELKRLESLESQDAKESVKFQIQNFMSMSEAQSSALEETGSSELIRAGESGEIVPFLKRQDSCSDADDTRPGSESGNLDFRPYRQQHRPSVIREDSDVEVTEGQHQEQKEFHFGLSTTTFQKRPYQQSYQQHEQNTDQFKDGSLELISFEEENYEKYYYGREHWNYFTNDELLGPVMLSLKQEVNNQRDHFHVLLRTVSYTLHGTIPASTICADRYDREAIVKELSEIAKLKPPLMLGQLPSTPDELLKLDHIFIKTELKVGVIYIKAGQAESEESILGNKEESSLFTEFLDLLGDRITLKGFDRYKGGLDTVHNLTGTESVYTMWRNIEIMFHVSTMLPHEENDPQKLQKKRHIGNDIVCVAFIESDDTLFWPGCIKSYFLHTFITVRTSPKPLKEGEKRKYSVSCVCRNEVQYAFKPYLVEQDEFFKSDYFREWLLVKIVNGERASYSAPKFARMQDRTRSQLLEDIITNLANHLVTGQIPKPYRRGSWRPLGHTRASSPLEDSMKDYFEDYDALAKDFCNAFCGPSRTMLCDVVFRVKDKDGTYKLVHGVRAIMAIRSRTFLEMLYGFVPPGTAPSTLQNQTNLRAIEMKALSGESSSGAGSGRELEQSNPKTLLAKRGSVGADSGRKIGEKERRQSMLPNLSKSIAQKPNYLTVPSTSGGGGAGAGAGGSTGGMIKNAFNRLVSGNWSGWSGNMKGYKGEVIKVDQNKTKVDLNSLAICKEIAKIDPDKLAQREFEIKEFDYETFQQTIEYIHNGQCKLSYETIPGLICAAEHYDLPDLLLACFHHAQTHMKLGAAPKMMNLLYQSSCFYTTAQQLLEAIYAFIDPLGTEFFSRLEYFDLYESVFTDLLTRKSLQVSEAKKFQAMHGWAKQKALEKQHEKQRQQHQQLQSQQSGDQEVMDFEREPSVTAEEAEVEYRNLMIRLNKEVNIKLDKISNEDLVKLVLPTKVFSNDKIFDIMADESRNEY